MKLAYIFTSAGLKSDSVQRKVMAQIEAMKYAGIDCKGVFFSFEVKEKTVYSDGIQMLPLERCKWKYFQRIGQNKLLLKAIDNAIRKDIDADSYLYLRYFGASRDLYRLAKRYGQRLISEHQSKEVAEIRSAKNENPFGLSVSKLLGYFQYRLWPVYNETFWGKRYARKIKSIVTVTGEIAEYQKAKGCRSVWTIPNGIETARYALRTVPDLTDELNILFLKGTSTMASWNGIDRLVDSIDRYHRTDLKIRLIICGQHIPGEIPERDYIEHKGYLDEKALDILFSEVHIGVSTLCLFRKNLREASVLKAREYFTRGLPFVYAYNDPDLDNSAAVVHNTLKVSNDDSLIDMDAVIAFARERSAQKQHPAEMRAFAAEYLDWKAKMKELKAAMLSIS